MRPTHGVPTVQPHLAGPARLRRPPRWIRRPPGWIRRSPVRPRTHSPKWTYVRTFLVSISVCESVQLRVCISMALFLVRFRPTPRTALCGQKRRRSASGQTRAKDPRVDVEDSSPRGPQYPTGGGHTQITVHARLQCKTWPHGRRFVASPSAFWLVCMVT